MNIRNYKGLRDGRVSFEQNNIVIGKNNVGKTTLFRAFRDFQLSELQLESVNSDLLLKLKEDWAVNDEVSLEITYEWERLNQEYLKLMTSFSTSGATRVKICWRVDESLVSTDEPMNTWFKKEMWVGPDANFDEEKIEVRPSDLKYFLPREVSAGEDPLNVGEFGVFWIRASRYVSSGQDGNVATTLKQLKPYLDSTLSGDDVENAKLKIEEIVSNQIEPKMGKIKRDLIDFAYPQNQMKQLTAKLDVDKFLDDPTVRLAQVIPDLPDFELGLDSQGFGYQNLYNILVRLQNLFSRITPTEKQRPLMMVIEEPEAYTHPQLQQVFINRIVSYIDREAGQKGVSIQLFIVSHSAEVAIAGLEEKFNLVIGKSGNNNFVNWSNLDKVSANKLQKLLMNTNGDVLFADKVIAYEGDAERILLPAFLKKMANENPNILAQKIALLPVGTHFESYEKALVHLGYSRIALITDIDFIQTESRTKYEENLPKEKTRTSNPMINRLALVTLDGLNQFNGGAVDFPNEYETPTVLRMFTQNKLDDIWPRTLELALFAVNMKLYQSIKIGVGLNNPTNKIDKLLTGSKTSFALDTLEILEEGDFTIPMYIKDALSWISEEEQSDD